MLCICSLCHFVWIYLKQEKHSYCVFWTQAIFFNDCVQQKKSLSERSLILYYDWFLHLDPAKIRR